MKQRWLYQLEFYKGPDENAGVLYIQFAMNTQNPAEALMRILRSDPVRGFGDLKNFSGPLRWSGNIWVE